MRDFFTTAEVASLLDVDTWQVRRLFEDGTLPDPPRLGRNRMIPRGQLPEIVLALVLKGFMPPEAKLKVEADSN